MNVQIKSLGVHYPTKIKTNEEFFDNDKDLLKNFENKQLNKAFSLVGDNKDQLTLYEQTMKKYLDDPFRGAVKRRVLSGDETTIGMEYEVAKKTIEAAGLETKDIDLLICCTVIPENFPGNSAFLARKLNLQGSAWNLESACAGGIVASQVADSLIRTKQYKNILITISVNYSIFCDPKDTLQMFLGDGAGALLLSSTNENSGILGYKSIHTGNTIESFYIDSKIADDGSIKRYIKTKPQINKVLRDTSSECLKTCVYGACEDANVKFEDIDFFTFNTPTAWYAEFCAKSLGVPYSKTLSTFGDFANVGPVLMPTNLYFAAKQNKIKKGDLVLTYSIGSVSTAGAIVTRWGDTKLTEFN